MNIPSGEVLQQKSRLDRYLAVAVGFDAVVVVVQDMDHITIGASNLPYNVDLKDITLSLDFHHWWLRSTYPSSHKV